MLKAIGYILFLVVAVTIAMAAAHFYGNWRAGDIYARATRGQTEAAIINELGPPDNESPCGEYLWWDGDFVNPPANNGICVKWVRYNYFLSAWAFGYSAEGKLVSRYHYVSE